MLEVSTGTERGYPGKTEERGKVSPVRTLIEAASSESRSSQESHSNPWRLIEDGKYRDVRVTIEVKVTGRMSLEVPGRVDEDKPHSIVTRAN